MFTAEKLPSLHKNIGHNNVLIKMTVQTLAMLLELCVLAQHFADLPDKTELYLSV